jgi:hypothetical protein
MSDKSPKHSLTATAQVAVKSVFRSLGRYIGVLAGDWFRSATFPIFDRVGQQDAAIVEYKANQNDPSASVGS